MNWDYLLEEPEFEDEYVEQLLDDDGDYDYDDCLTELDIGDYRSDEYERTINQNY